MSSETVDNSIAAQGQSLFGRPTSQVEKMERSREALLLRLEQMNNKERELHDSNEIEKSESDSSTSSSSAHSTTKSHAIPIKKKNRPANHEGRGFTDDMMFFATACLSCSSDESEGKNVDEPFVPPHLQQYDSFTFRSYV